MGINAYDLRLLIKLMDKGLIRGQSSVMEIGAQQLDDDFLFARAELETMARLCGVAQPCPLPSPRAVPPDIGGRHPLDASAPSARQFWTWLGFDYASIDIDGSPGSIPLDLNYDNLRASMKGKFQLVTNYGTTEHVTNQLNAFKIIHNLTSHGGIMIHSVPAQGMFNHGLVNYNPKFFWMLSRSNGYRWLHMDLSPGTAISLPANVVDMTSTFSPGFAERARSYSVADCGIVVVMQKIHNIAFVPPLDVTTGTQTENVALRKRYWTVFKPGVFVEMEERARKGRRARLLDALKSLVPPPLRRVRTTRDRRRLPHDDLPSSAAETGEPKDRVDSKQGKS
jgi:hypothetical protein